MSNLHPGPWEYRAEPAPGIGHLNELGARGWELVGIEDGVFYLKRPALNFRDRVTLDQKRHYYEQARQGASKSGADR